MMFETPICCALLGLGRYRDAGYRCLGEQQCDSDEKRPFADFR
ncbi:hypothetical protein [Candidatus Poriferisocius sp.]